jgi:hypothetical protein
LRLEPLYTLRFFYLDGWEIILRDPSDSNGTITEEEHFYLPEVACEGRITGSFRGANHPHRRIDKTFVMNIQGFIQTNDGATIMTDIQGYGRSYQRSQLLYGIYSDENTEFRRQVVGTAKHITDNPKYLWLNNSICAIAGEVRTPPDIPAETIRQADVKLDFRVSEVVWEPPPE